MNIVISLCFITCAVILVCTVSEQLTNKWTRLTSLDGYLASQGTVRLASSRVHCGRLCMGTHGCQSFFFIGGEEETNCQLHEEILTTISGLIQTLNASYYFSVSYPPFPNDGLYHTTMLSDNNLFTFKLHNQTQTYDGAVLTCTSENARLVRITTTAKFDMLRTVLNQPGYVFTYYIYVDGFLEADVWYFNNQDVATFPDSFWAPDEPLDDAAFNCILLVYDRFWHAENWGCDFVDNFFICEK